MSSPLLALLLIALAALGPSPTAAGPANQCLGTAATIQGTSGPDVITGTEGDDVIVGKEGNDRISGLGGNDLICGDTGKDVLDGGAGDDTLNGGTQGDTFVCNVGIDTVSYEERTGPVIAEIDKDTGDDGDPTLRGGKGEGDTIKISCENVIGGTGNDSMVGTNG
ncbi:MAG: calcium-binding protein, partial [Actinomycetota bacterium]